MSEHCYQGSELEVFAHAVNWKAYVQSKLNPYLAGEVLEIGAGIGAATRFFNTAMQSPWVCLEPDPHLASRISSEVVPNLPNCEVIVGTLFDVKPERFFDSILYMDVLEHIEDDAEELRIAARHLRTNGFLIVLSPALPWLYTPFDRAIGHYRRYTRRSLRAVAPQELHEKECIYLDTFGTLASTGNRLLLHSASPTQAQITFWDTFLVPLSRFVDSKLNYVLGKSILGVWQKIA